MIVWDYFRYWCDLFRNLLPLDVESMFGKAILWICSGLWDLRYGYCVSTGLFPDAAGHGSGFGTLHPGRKCTFAPDLFDILTRNTHTDTHVRPRNKSWISVWIINAGINPWNVRVQFPYSTNELAHYVGFIPAALYCTSGFSAGETYPTNLQIRSCTVHQFRKYKMDRFGSIYILTHPGVNTKPVRNVKLLLRRTFWHLTKDIRESRQGEDAAIWKSIKTRIFYVENATLTDHFSWKHVKNSCRRDIQPDARQFQGKKGYTRVVRKVFSLIKTIRLH